MKAIVTIEIEINDGFFKNKEEEQLFTEAETGAKITWIKGKAIKELENVLENEMKVKIYE